MFRKSAYRDDPETKKYGLWMHGIPMFYAGPTKTDLQISWDRRLADARKPGWRAYLLKKAELAVDAGVDAIVWDNMIGYNDGLAQLLDDTQRMVERKAAGDRPAQGHGLCQHPHFAGPVCDERHERGDLGGGRQGHSRCVGRSLAGRQRAQYQIPERREAALAAPDV